MPTLYVVAGPNGCGKSTLTRTAWLSDLDIIDPDEIARATASATPAAAAREALLRRRAALRTGRTHLLETTLAGSGAIRHMEAARAAGLRVESYYVCGVARSGASPHSNPRRGRWPPRPGNGRATAVCAVAGQPAGSDRAVPRGAPLRQQRPRRAPSRGRSDDGRDVAGSRGPSGLGGGGNRAHTAVAPVGWGRGRRKFSADPSA